MRGFAFLDINTSQIPGSGDEGRPLFAEFGRTTATREWDGRTHSTYHSLQLTLNRRFINGLLVRAYTYSKAIDEAQSGTGRDAFGRPREFRLGLRLSF